MIIIVVYQVFPHAPLHLHMAEEVGASGRDGLREFDVGWWHVARAIHCKADSEKGIDSIAPCFSNAVRLRNCPPLQ